MNTDIIKKTVKAPSPETTNDTGKPGVIDLWNEFGGTLKVVIITAVLCIIVVLLTLIVKIIIG